MIRLKTPRRDDLRFIRWLWSDPETMRPVGGALRLTNEQTQRWFETAVRPGNAIIHYRLVCDGQGNPVGEVSCRHLGSATPRAELNVKIAHNRQGQGYGKEAATLFTRSFFEELGGQELVADVALTNTAGRVLLEKSGFERDPVVERVHRLRLTRERFESFYNF